MNDTMKLDFKKVLRFISKFTIKALKIKKNIKNLKYKIDLKASFVSCTKKKLKQLENKRVRKNNEITKKSLLLYHLNKLYL